MKSIESEILEDVFSKVKFMDVKWMINEIESFIYAHEEQFTDNGMLIKSFSTRFDKLHGEYKEFDASRSTRKTNSLQQRLKLHAFYEDGELHGPYNSYYENSFNQSSNLQISRCYKHGVLDGDYFSYSAEGQMLLATSFKDGKLHGDYLAFFDNGNQFCERHYNNGELVGVHKEWNRKGKLFFEKNYD